MIIITVTITIIITIIDIIIIIITMGHGGSVVGFGAFRPEGRRFESHYTHHGRYFGQVLHSQLPVALWRVNFDTVSMLQSEALLKGSC